MMADVMTCQPSDVQQPHGLTADEERHLAAECARLGSWPRTVTIERTGTQYIIPNRRKAERLLRALRIEHEK